MQGLLKDFINHGVLPFVGREGESTRVMAFWRETATSPRLRMALLLGEAGIGKSRLVEECIPRIMDEGGSIIHTKLYPESTASLVPLIARALRLGSSRRPFATPVSSGDTLASVVAEMRQMARLRPTMVIVEDIHLLRGDAREELARLVETLSDEVVSILLLAPPVELAVRPIVEPYLVEEIQIRTLGERDLADLWHRLFDTTPDPKIIKLLHNATHGNPLAIRSALRGALRSGAIVYDPTVGSWRSTIPLPSLEQILKRNVELLSEGMVALLADRERHAAAILATLGEIFAREAAEAILPDAGGMIDALIDKGILVRASTSAAPLAGSASSHPLIAFTHTILHTYLMQQKGMEGRELISLIASDIPLYSILPFQLLTRERSFIAPPKEEAERAIMHTIDVAVALDESADWELGLEVWKGASAIMTITAGIWSDTEKRRLQVELLCARLLLMRRSDANDRYEPLVRELLAVTAEPIPPALLKYRLKAFSYLHKLGRRTEPEMCRQTWEEAQEFIARHPELKLEMEYLVYLESAARSMFYIGDMERLRLIEKQLTALSTLAEGSESYRAMAKQIIAFNFLEIFENQEELEARVQLIEEVESMVKYRRRMMLAISKILLFNSTGQMHRVIETSDAMIPIFKEQGLVNNYLYGSLCRLCALAAFGAGFGPIAAGIEELCRNGTKEIHPFQLIGKSALIEQALLCGADDWLRASLGRYGRVCEQLSPGAQLLLALEFGISQERIAAGLRHGGKTFRPLAELFIAGEPDARLAYPALKHALGAPVLRIADLLEKRAILASLPELARRLDVPKLADVFESDMRNALLAALAWLDERELVGYMIPFLDRHGSLLPPAELAHWRSRAAVHGREHQPSTPPADVPDRIRIKMLGTIEVHPPGGEEIPIRGARLRTLIGLMVAERMLDEPLDYREFSSIVADTDDPDKARKTLNGVVFRLRELLGHDAILTQEETPKLNSDLLEVDLLEANSALGEAAAALRDGSLIRAQRKLLHVLAITHGEVPFPTLYENFFETVRDTFENQLRALLLKVSKGLLSERDPKSAEELLRGGFAAMSGDEELAELLCEALVMLGKRTEAERVRMRMEEGG